MSRFFILLSILFSSTIDCVAETSLHTDSTVNYISVFLNVFFVFAGALAFYILNRKWKAQQFDKMQKEKLKFFSDLSYEIRTPLTLIMTPLAKIIAKGDNPSLLPTYNMMFKHANELLQLINQIKDLHFLEFSKKHIYVEEMNITQLVSKLKDSFDILAEDKELDFSFHSSPETIIGYADRDVLSMVLFNLISASIRRTEKGYVRIEMSSQNTSELFIRIEYSGMPMPDYMQKLVYDKYFSLERTDDDVAIKSALPLHLTNKIVKLHHGEFDMESLQSGGNVFKLKIPISKDSYTREEQSGKEDVDMEFSTAPVLNCNVRTLSSETKKINHKDNKPRILVVEDNSDIRLLLKEEFSDDYSIIEAENGKDALHKTLEYNPDIIISDILMPEMDGREFCRKIRNNESTKLIPIILLTACSSKSQQVEGLQIGADAYVTKPFDLDYLRALVSRLLQSRAQNRQQVLADTEEKEEDTLKESSSVDKMILDNINKLIQEHLDDSAFSVEQLCKEMSLSRTHLNRKVKELTGESPASYIKQIRLRKAAALLKKKSLSISEIAFMTGFSSPSYFSQAFREYYGLTPKEFVNHTNQE